MVLEDSIRLTLYKKKLVPVIILDHPNLENSPFTWPEKRRSLDSHGHSGNLKYGIQNLK